MRALLSLGTLGLLAACSVAYEPDVDLASVDGARYAADLKLCRSRSNAFAAGADQGTAETVSPPIGPLSLSAGGAGSNLAPAGQTHRADVDSCLADKGYRLK